MAAIVINVAGTYDDKAISQAQKRLEDLKGSGAAAGAGLAGAFTAAGAKMNAFGASMVAFGGKLTKSVTLPIVGLGVGAAVAFDKVDNALDTTAARSGFTGEALTGLQDSFKKVAASATQDMETVGEVIGGIAGKLNLSGPALETFTSQVLDLARVTGVDAQTAADSLTTAMNALGVSAADATPLMDSLLSASQRSGMSIDTLSAQLATAAPAFRTYGIGVEQSVGLLAAFGRAGIPSTRVVAGLSTAFKNLREDGVKDLPAGLADVFTRIQNAKNPTKATAIAVDTFGSRVGVTLADAIRTGKVSLEDLQAGLAGTEGALADAVTATDGPQESFARLKNQAMLLGASFAELALPIVDRLVPAIQQVVTWFQNLDPNVKQTIVTVAAVAAAVGPLIMILGKLVMGIGAVSTAMGFLIANPVVLAIVAIVAAIAGLVVGLKYAYENFEGFRNFVNAVWAGIQAAVGYVVDWFMAYVWPILQEVFGYISVGVQYMGEVFAAAWNAILPVVEKAVAWFMEYVWPTLDKVFQFLGVSLGVLWNAYKAYWTLIANAVRVVVEWFMAYVWPTLSKVFGFIGTALGVLWDAYKRYWTFIFDLVKKVATWFMDTMWPLIRTAFDNAKRGAELLWQGIQAAFNFIKSHVQNAVSVITSVLRGIGTIVSTVIGFFDKIRQGIIDKVTAAVDWLRNLGQTILSAIGDLSRLLYDIGKSILTGLLDGMKAGWETVSGWVGNVGGWIADLKGPIEKDRVLLVPQGRAIMEGLGRGLQAGFRFVVGVTGDITRLVQRAARKVQDAAAAMAAATTKEAKEAARKAYEDAVEAQRELNRRIRQVVLDTATDALQRFRDRAKDVIDYVAGVVASIRDFGKLSGFDLNAIDQARKALVDAQDAVTEAIKDRAKAQARLNKVEAEGSDEEKAEAREALAEASNKVIDAQARLDAATRQVAATTPNAANILGDMRRRLSAATGFASIVRQLSAMGLNNASLQEIIGQGPGAGATLGEALIMGGPQAIAEINMLEDALRGVGEAIGDVGARSQYGMGLTSARGIANTNVTMQSGAVVVNFGQGVDPRDRAQIEADIQRAVDVALGALAREISAS